MDIINSIKFCRDKRKVASVYLDKEDTCHHLTGYITACNDDEVLIAHINTRGEYDGFIYEYASNVYRVDYDGEYEDKIGTLYKLKHQSHPQFEPDEENILFSLLKFAENSEFLVSLEDEENSVTGFLKSFSDTQIELETVNDYGKYSGVTVIDLEMVETISVDTDYEQDVKLLQIIIQRTVLCVESRAKQLKCVYLFNNTPPWLKRTLCGTEATITTARQVITISNHAIILLKSAGS